MATNPPSTVRVTIGQNNPSVTALSYGSRTLKSAADLNLTNAQDGYPIIYQANTNTFVVGPARAEILSVDNGFF